MAEKLENYFKELYGIDVNDRTYKKKDLTYLSWASAWSEMKKVYPDADYELKKFEKTREITHKKMLENGDVVETRETTKALVPYVETEMGIVVYTSVTANGVTHEMHLTVMDGANKSMRSVPYSYSTKFGDKTVEAAAMFDISKAIMRCLTKNIALHGVGLYIYEKDSLPSAIVDLQKLQQECLDVINKKAALSEDAKKKVADICKEEMPDENGDPRLVEDEERLKALKKRLLGIRK